MLIRQEQSGIIKEELIRKVINAALEDQNMGLAFCFILFLLITFFDSKADDLQK